MIKYVLNSGGVKRYPKLKQKFHRELIKDFGNHPKFLICSFAQVREDWNVKFRGYCDAVAEDMPTGTVPTFELAMPDAFESQCQSADIIYFNGGDDTLLKYWLGQLDLPKVFQDKVVGTSSASSDVLTAHFWTCDWRQCLDGLGLLPIKFIPHYQSDFGMDDPRGPIDWQHAYNELKDYGDPSLHIHTLQEGEFVVFET